MASSINEKIASLVTQAINEDRLDVLLALKDFSPVEELSKSLSESLSKGKAFNETWAGILNKTEYSQAETEKLAENLEFGDVAYSDYYKSLIKSHALTESGNRLLYSAMAKGHHDLVLGSLTDEAITKEFRGFMHDAVSEYVTQIPHLYFSITGQHLTVNSSTLDLLDRLDLDVPAQFVSSDYPGRNATDRPNWSADRFWGNVEAVGETLQDTGIEIPKLEIKNGIFEWDDSRFIHALSIEGERVSRLGGWHSINFPKYAPITCSMEALESSAVSSFPKVKPALTTTAKASTSHSTYLSRRFLQDSNHDLTQGDIDLAMSLLGPKHVRDLINSEKSVILLPVALLSEIAPLRQPAPRKLSQALRYHRPEILISTDHKVTNNSDRNFPAALYLKGADVQHTQYQTLHVWDNVHHAKGLLDYMTDAERVWGRENYANNDQAVDLNHDHRLSDAENAERFIQTVKSIESSLGVFPKVSFRTKIGVYKELAAGSFVFKNGIAYKDEKGNSSDDWFTSREGYRALAKLGSLGWENHFEEIPFDQLLSKATRLKDPKTGFNTDKEKIFGLLDRHPIEEVIKTAKTSSQWDTLIKNFDLSKHTHLLPKSIALNLDGKAFTQELGV